MEKYEKMFEYEKIYYDKKDISKYFNINIKKLSKFVLSINHSWVINS